MQQNYLDRLASPDLRRFLDVRAESADRESAWPKESWQRLRDCGVLAWSLPREFGGLGLSGPELLAGYERVAGACLTTAFILSQREAAVRRLLAAPPSPMRDRYLPALARGEVFFTVGLSQLTTSHQHLSPALTAESQPGGGYLLHGTIPWVTGADRANGVVIGAPLPDGLQILLVLPRDHPGVTVEEPLPLMALSGSRTARLRCADVRLGSECLLAGPSEKILAGKSGGVGGLETSCLALGLAGAAIDYLCEEASKRAELAAAVERFVAARNRYQRCLAELAETACDADVLTNVRVACTQLALQASQTALIVAKGAGFVAGHPAQRWARQALFFLVWSCPRPAAEGILAHLLPQ